MCDGNAGRAYIYGFSVGRILCHCVIFAAQGSDTFFVDLQIASSNASSGLECVIGWRGGAAAGGIPRGPWLTDAVVCGRVLKYEG